MAEENFQELIHKVQMSGLNYKIEMSPFSAKVFLKKTFTKNLNGNQLKPKLSAEPTFEQIKAENKLLSNRVNYLERTSNNHASQYEQTLFHYQQMYQTNAYLLEKIENLHSNLSTTKDENLRFKLLQEQANSSDDKIKLEHDISEQTDEVFTLISYNEGLKEQVERLNCELCETKETFDNDIEEV